MPVKVIIVEDQEMIREYVRWICTKELGYEVVGETDRGSEAHKLIEDLCPDLLIIDLIIADEDGFSVAERACSTRPGLRIILMSAHCDAVTIRRVEQARVNGFIDKNFSQMAEFKRAFQAVMAGQSFFSQSYKAAVRQRRADPRSFDKLLTDREQQVAGFIACALDDNEIAGKLKISASTVETHRRNIMKKLGIESTPKLIKYAIDHGFINFLTQVRNPRQVMDRLSTFMCLPLLVDFLSSFCL